MMRPPVASVLSRSSGALVLACCVAPLAFGSLASAQTAVGWGRNNRNQLTVPSDATAVRSIACGLDHSSARLASGVVRCWGLNAWGQCDVPVDVRDACSVAAGDMHSLCVAADGRVHAWGDNFSGQCDVPTDLGAAVQAAAGYQYSGVLLADGTVRLWGFNQSGQCDPPIGLARVTRLRLGSDHAVAVSADGSVSAWGLGDVGQTSVPVGLGPVKDVAAGGLHSLALQSSGAVVAWGDNFYGQQTVPPSAQNAVAVAAGLFHSLALRSDGTVVAWGAGTTATGGVNFGQSLVPASVSNAIAIEAGGYFSFAVTRASGIQPPSAAIVATSSASCGLSNGSIDAEIGDELTHFWTGPNGFFSTATDPAGLAAGTYTLTVQGAGGLITRTVLVEPGANQPPVFDSYPTVASIPVEAMGCVGLVPDLAPGVVAHDDCGTVTISQVPAAGTPVDLFPGSFAMQLIATDQDGASTTVAVTLEPTTAVPALTIYTDQDRDGFGESGFVHYCSASDPPEGFALMTGDCDDTRLLYEDQDGDGYGAGLPVACGVPVAGDCNDLSDAVSPAKDEVCDPLDTDEDCDNAVDDLDGSVLDSSRRDYYIDQDMDGFAIDMATRFCDLQLPYRAAPGGDCDDSNPHVHPQGMEVCDAGNTDENCNGLSDDSDASVQEASRTDFFFDGDSDGYTTGSAVRFCDPPDRFVSVPSAAPDCNDANGAVHPGAVENCANLAVDNDCDGNSDAGEAVDASDYFLDSDGDGFGAGNSVRSCTPVGGHATNDLDGCPNDPGKSAPGTCGCGVSDADSDGDGVADCNDGCPNDAMKVAPGICGCGVADVDFDSDGVADCADECPNDPAKTAPGACGCGVADADANADGVPDCRDLQLSLSSSAQAVRPDQALEVTIASSTSPTSPLLVGVQFAIRFDPTLLRLDGIADPEGGSAFPFTLASQIDNTAGSLLHAATVDFIGGAPVSPSGPLLHLHFTVLHGAAACDASRSVSFGSVGALVTQLALAEGGALHPVCTGLAALTIDGVAPNYTGGASIELAADADCTVAVPDLRNGFSDNCTSGDLLQRTQVPAPGTRAPLGVTDITVSAVDQVGNSASSVVSLHVTGAQLAYYPDADHDGFGASGSSPLLSCAQPPNTSTSATDCNDADATIKPTAMEVCDPSSTDENCNGLAEDLDPTLNAATRNAYYADADQDLHAAMIPSLFCHAPAGYQSTGGDDCNDAEASIHPGATEDCANLAIDNDCDGVSSDDEAVNSISFYADRDADGFGAGPATRSCTALAGLVTNNFDCDDAAVMFLDGDGDLYGAGAMIACGGVETNDDCNDSDASIHPGATEDCANLAIDNDCDGERSDAEAVDSVSYYGDGDHDGFGAGLATRSCTAIAGSVTNNIDCDDAAVMYRDGDGDLYGAGAMIACGGVETNDDCNDAAVLIHPGATEDCANLAIDNDCDGVSSADEAVDSVSYYADGDHDGFGAGLATRSCTAITGSVANNIDCDDAAVMYRDGDGDLYGAGAMVACGGVATDSDCNDASAAIHPGAAELCATTGVDDNCNGDSAEVDAGASDKRDYYLDLDGDAYSYGPPTRYCLGQAGPGRVLYLSDPMDCDDSNPAIYPGVPELCATKGVDNNCNSATNPDLDEVDAQAFDKATYYRDADLDSYTARDAQGFPVTAEFCPGDQPAGYDASASASLDCDDTNGSIHPGAVDTCSDGIDNNCNGQIDENCTGSGPFTLSLAGSAASIRPGEAFTVHAVCTAPPSAMGGCQLAIHFDRSRLRLDSVTPVGTGPMSLELSEQIDNPNGTLRYAIGLSDPSNPLTGAAELCDLAFTVLGGGDLCGAVHLVTFENVGPFTTRFVGSNGAVTVPVLANLPATNLDTVAPVLAGVPAADIDVAADAGSTVGAHVLIPTVTATDNCDGAVAVSTTGVPADGVFPVGTTTVSWTATDAAGNASSATRTVTVQPYQLLDATVTMNGFGVAPMARSVRFGAGGTAVVRTVNLTETIRSASGNYVIAVRGVASGIAVPVGQVLGCVSAKDPAHSLTAVSPASVSGTRWTAALLLDQGDSNDDDMVEILDYGFWLVDRRPDGAGSAARSNFNGDAAVNSADFGYVSVNFFRVGESCTPGAHAPSPRTRISVKELRRRGLGDLVAADLNHDGWLDVRDVQAGLQGAGSGDAGRPRTSDGVAW